MATLDDILATAPLFAGLSEGSRRALAAALKPKGLRRGETLFKQGQRGDAMHVIVDGELAVRCEEADGGTVEVARVGSGEVVGEMSALDPAPRSATVEAVTDAQIYQFDRTMFDALARNAPSLAVALVDGLAKMLTARLRDTNERIKAASQRVEDDFQPGPFPPASPGAPYTNPIDLRKVPSLEGYTDDELARLAEVAPPMLYGDGEYLCREGAPGDACYILAGGKVDVVKELRDGKQKVLATLRAGTIVGQLALLDDTPRSASIRALGNAGVLAIARPEFRRLLDSYDSLALKLHQQVTVAGVRQLRMANSHITRLLARKPDPIQPASRPMPTAPRKPDARKSTGTQQWRGPKPPPPRRKPAPRAGGEPLWRTLMQRRAKPEQDEAPRSRPAKAAAPAKKKEIDFSNRSRIPKKDEVLTGKGLLNEDYISAALGEWGMSLDDLDKIQVVKPDGQMSQAELKARLGG